MSFAVRNAAFVVYFAAIILFPFAAFAGNDESDSGAQAGEDQPSRGLESDRTEKKMPEKSPAGENTRPRSFHLPESNIFQNPQLFDDEAPGYDEELEEEEGSQDWFYEDGEEDKGRFQRI